MQFRWNDNDKKSSFHFPGVLTYFIYVFFLFFISFPTLAENIHNRVLHSIVEIESSFYQISSEFYAEQANDTDSSTKKLDDFGQLSQRVKTLNSNDQYVEAIQLIHRNLSTINRNLDDPEILTLLEILLQHNDIKLANTLSETIRDEGDDFQLANINFMFARYHAGRQEWQAVLKRLDKSIADLSEQNSEYALLLQGSALQNLKLQRQAAAVYQKIPATSEYYRYAQLNFAITQIRQDWLSSAQLTIRDLVKNSEVSDNELTNRLRLVLGYALLRKNYFRDARNTFRKISQHSQYVNQALLGIALCAINQDDPERALNSLTILQSKITRDLPVDESYLLVNYVYEKLGQSQNVIASATQAMDYYQNRITELQSIDVQNLKYSELSINPQNTLITLDNIPINYAELYPLSFLKNYQELLTFRRLNNSDVLAKEIEQLITRSANTLQLMIENLINRKIGFLDSYLNQVRYGLARLYDNTGREQ